MIKVCIFNKSNNVLRFNIFRKLFECINSKISLMGCTETDTIRRYDTIYYLTEKLTGKLPV